MCLKNSMLFLFSLILILPLSAQHSNEKAADSTVVERRKKYEETLKFLEEVRRRREKDPRRFMDSIAQLRKQKLYEKAHVRLKEYEGADLSRYRELDLTGAQLQRIPEWVYGAENLEVLILDHNEIRELPRELGDLPNLKRIYWRYNQLGGPPA